MDMKVRDVTYQSGDGLDLYARIRGDDAQPVTALCMHGLTRNHRDFDPMIDALQAAGAPCRFVSPDVRGRGRSQWDPDPSRYTPAVYGADMVRLMDRLGIDRAVLVGTSMGGIMSMVLGQLAPEKIAAVALNDIGPRIDEAGLDRIRSYVGGTPVHTDWRAAAQAVADVNADAFPDFDDSDWLAFARRLCRETPEGGVVADYDPAISGTFAPTETAAQQEAVAWGLFDDLSYCPMLIIRGELSDILSEETALQMQEHHGDARIVRVPRRGHAPILDEPPAVAALLDLIERVRAEQS